MAATDIRAALEQQRQSRSQSSWFGILKESASQWVDADAMTWSAALSCYTVLALAPLLVVAVKIATVLFRNESARAEQTIRDQATNWMGSPEAGQAIAAILDRIIHQKGGLMAAIISGFIAILSIGGVFAELQQAMNRIWRVKPQPGGAIWGFVRSRLLSIVVVGIAAVLLLGSVYVSGWLERFSGHIGMGWRFVAFGIDLVVSTAVLTVIFGMVYRTVPDAEIEWKSTWVGALISALLFQVGKFGLTLYFRYAAPASAFGAAGSLAAVLIWIYYSSMIVFFGAQFTYVYAMRRGHGVRASKHARPLSECDETETATPSSEPPSRKPPKPAPPHSPPRRPAASPSHAPAPSPYGAVLGRYSMAESPAAADQAMSGSDERAAREDRLRQYLIAGASLALGAAIGGYGAMQGGRTPPAAPKINPKRARALQLRDRFERAQAQLADAARIREYLDRDDAVDRLERVRQAVVHERHARGLRPFGPPPVPSTAGKWARRVARAVRSITS